jgi:hypothetical protein
VLGALVCGLVVGGVVLAKAVAPPPDEAALRGGEALSIARRALGDSQPAAEPMPGVTVIEGGEVAPALAPGVAPGDDVSGGTPTADDSIGESEGATSGPGPALVAQTAPDAGAPAPEPAPVETAPIDEAEPPQGCGIATCAAGYTCCNISCGICVPKGETCDPTQCQGRARYPVSTMCGQNTCSVGQVCCNPTCGTCVAEGESCDETPCTPRIQAPISTMCGQNTCSVGQVCCNPTCGTCVAEGESCDETPCTPRIQAPIGMMCGQNTCSVGQVCCNPTCGTCVAEGESCDETPCTPRIRYF